jgi:hypothetical protein
VKHGDTKPLNQINLHELPPRIKKMVMWLITHADAISTGSKIQVVLTFDCAGDVVRGKIEEHFQIQ